MLSVEHVRAKRDGNRLRLQELPPSKRARVRELALELSEILVASVGDDRDTVESRLSELQSRTSLLNPLWYAGSFAIGALAATFGDRVSLGFVSETERQVEGHLDDHLARLPAGDSRSRAIVEAMRADEISHGAAARAAGGEELPAPARALMKHTARVMTRTAYWI